NLLLCALPVLLLSGCTVRGRHGGDGVGTDKPPVSVAVAPATATIPLQPSGNARFSGSLHLTATATYADGTTADVTQVATWTASEPSAAVGQGDVTLTAVGEYTVTATVASVSGAAKLLATLSGSADNSGFNAGDHGKLDGM